MAVLVIFIVPVARTGVLASLVIKPGSASVAARAARYPAQSDSVCDLLDQLVLVA